LASPKRRRSNIFAHGHCITPAPAPCDDHGQLTVLKGLPSADSSSHFSPEPPPSQIGAHTCLGSRPHERSALIFVSGAVLTTDPRSCLSREPFPRQIRAHIRLGSRSRERSALRFVSGAVPTTDPRSHSSRVPSPGQFPAHICLGSVPAVRLEFAFLGSRSHARLQSHRQWMKDEHGPRTINSCLGAQSNLGTREGTHDALPWPPVASGSWRWCEISGQEGYRECIDLCVAFSIRLVKPVAERVLMLVYLVKLRGSIPVVSKTRGAVVCAVQFFYRTLNG
jgi:hypothetical protein